MGWGTARAESQVIFCVSAANQGQSMYQFSLKAFHGGSRGASWWQSFWCLRCTLSLQHLSQPCDPLEKYNLKN